MKNFYFIIFLLLLFAIPFTAIGEVTLTIEPPTTEDHDPDGREVGRHRMPPAPIMCFIDMEAGTVTFSSSVLDEIDSYQLWDESGEICIGAYDSPADFATALTDLSGDYCLKFLTQKGIYTGYIKL